MKWALAVLFALGVGLILWDTSDLRQQENIVIIGTETGMGSGVYINPTTILTAKHVIAGDTDIAARLPREKSQEVIDVTINNDTDIALLTVSKPNKTWATLTCNYPLYGDNVTAYGHPIYLGWQMTKHTVTNRIAFPNSPPHYYESEYGNTYITLSGGIFRGMSGGPVVNRVGDVIGINSVVIYNSRTMNNRPLSSIVQSTAGICDWLRKNKVEFTQSKWDWFNRKKIYNALGIMTFN